MRILGRQFVMGRTIEEALERARGPESGGYRYSYDMLGEAAHTAADAERYMEAYSQAIVAVGGESAGRGVVEGPGVSIKLSALHPRYQFAQRERVMGELVPRLARLARQAQEADIGLCVDAEEADRLDLSLDVIEAVFADVAATGWEGFGLAVQAYQKRATFVLDWLSALARRHRRRLMVRLVKGAYWDTEIKRGQEQGLDGYPVFTRKVSTDVSYLACARKILACKDVFFPLFATHNAHTLAAVLELAGDFRDFEFQRLHGMGEALYEQVVGKEGLGARCRVYAPVGTHEDLLAYLARRLLENGANTSFLNRIVDRTAPIDDIIADPLAKAAALARKPHPRIPPPASLYGPERRNSRGLDLSDPASLRPLARAMAAAPGLRRRRRARRSRSRRPPPPGGRGGRGAGGRHRPRRGAGGRGRPRLGRDAGRRPGGVSGARRRPARGRHGGVDGDVRARGRQDHRRRPGRDPRGRRFLPLLRPNSPLTKSSLDEVGMV